MFTIVKYADNATWREHHFEDPRRGVDASQSCHTTYSARVVGIKAVYENEVQAMTDCRKLNDQNPGGHYDVCPVLPD